MTDETRAAVQAALDASDRALAACRVMLARPARRRSWWERLWTARP